MDLPYDSFVHVFHEATARAAGVGIPVEFEPNHFVKMLLPGSDSELAAYERFGLTVRTNNPIPGRQHGGGWYCAASPLGASDPATPSWSTTAGDGGRGAALGERYGRWWQLSLLLGRKCGAAPL